MLERIQPEIGEVGGLGIAEDAEDAAFVLEFIQHAELSRAERSHACRRADLQCMTHSRKRRHDFGESLYSTLPGP